MEDTELAMAHDIMLSAGVIMKLARNYKCAMYNVCITDSLYIKTLSHTQSTEFYWLDEVNRSIVWMISGRDWCQRNLGVIVCACNLACVFYVQNIWTSLPTWNLTHCRSVFTQYTCISFLCNLLKSKFLIVTVNYSHETVKFNQVTHP